MKKIIPICLLLLLCSYIYLTIRPNTSATFDKDMKRIAFVAPQKDLPVWQQAQNGFLAAAQEFVFFAEWTGSDDCDLEEMNRQIDIAIAEDIDAIITCPLTPGDFDDTFKKAKKENIPIITLAVDASESWMRDAFICPDYEKIGTDQASALYDKTGSPMKICVIMSTFDSQNQIIQVNQLKQFIKDKENCEIVATIQDFANPVTGMSNFTNILESHPEINAVFVTSGDAVSSYGKILSEKQLQNKISLIGMDAIDANIQSIQDGEIYGVMYQDFYEMGYLGGKYAVSLLNKETVPSLTFCDSMLITAENLNQFFPEVP